MEEHDERVRTAAVEDLRVLRTAVEGREEDAHRGGAKPGVEAAGSNVALGATMAGRRTTARVGPRRRLRRSRDPTGPITGGPTWCTPQNTGASAWAARDGAADLARGCSAADAPELGAVAGVAAVEDPAVRRAITQPRPERRVRVGQPAAGEVARRRRHQLQAAQRRALVPVQLVDAAPRHAPALEVRTDAERYDEGDARRTTVGWCPCRGGRSGRGR